MTARPPGRGAGPGRPSVAGVVLAGGASVRMGRDKALIEVGGGRLVDRAVERLGTLCQEVVVASGPRRIAGLTVAQVPDAPGAGPLAGIVAGLRAIDADVAAVVAVDLPDLSDAVLQRLVQRLLAGEAAGLVPVVAGRLQPLHAVYRRSIAPALERALASGERRTGRAVLDAGATTADASVWGDLDPLGRFARNVNRPADLTPRERRG